ncbi:hypothetical protein J2Z30_008558 [Streptomyces iranensis]|uniref:Alpha-L-rhamnosidase six-hairpin glycosidase domain-containing protein n=1 Tax=Streptomyces iranensis TaxID=576784 RepID=A0ABS4N677_9ACTN|nr:hypothetical protein [Streptomyces iranensis]
MASIGAFTSSSEDLNRIWKNNRWSILNNSMSTPTDTPVRDERTPPAMDVQAYRDAATREFGMAGFYAKYLRDLPPGTALPSDDVKAQYPDMAGGQVTLAWTLYEQYRDRDALETAYPDMTHWSTPPSPTSRRGPWRRPRTCSGTGGTRAISSPWRAASETRSTRTSSTKPVIRTAADAR